MNHLLVTLFAWLLSFPLLAQVPSNINLSEAGNYKAADPVGVGQAHFIERGQEITYTIYFQNSGSDTAFNVRVLDTLSIHFDLNSLREESASHPYDMTIFNENVVRFSFPNIKLPNRAADENKSKGFIRFTVSLKEDLPLLTFITNQAQVFFDFRPPVTTNEVYHRIGEGFTSIGDADNDELSVQLSPNPMSSNAFLDIQGTSFRTGQMEIFNLTGQSVRTHLFYQSRFEFSSTNLLSGQYYYKIILDGEWATTGRFVVQ
ncbi:MAG: T9SS type A sorting domain-containing protein [Bacteroidota bacterium]